MATKRAGRQDVWPIIEGLNFVRFGVAVTNGGQRKRRHTGVVAPMSTIAKVASLDVLTR